MQNLRKIKDNCNIIFKNDYISSFIYPNSNPMNVIILPEKKITSLKEMINQNIINQIIMSVEIIIKKLNLENKEYKLILNSKSNENSEIYFNLIFGSKLDVINKTNVRDPILYKSDLNYII